MSPISVDEKIRILEANPPDMSGWTQCGGCDMTREEESEALREVLARHDRGVLVLSAEQRARYAARIQELRAARCPHAGSPS